MKYQIRNVGAAAKADARLTGKILVQFPYNDYRVGRHIVTKAPKRHLKPRIKGRDAFVRFDNRVWKLTAKAWEVTDFVTGKPLRNDDGKRYKAIIFFDVDYEAEPTPA